MNLPPPGAYDVDNFNLATKIYKAAQEDPELVPLKPPFNMGAKRFNYKEDNISKFLFLNKYFSPLFLSK